MNSRQSFVFLFSDVEVEDNHPAMVTFMRLEGGDSFWDSREFELKILEDVIIKTSQDLALVYFLRSF